MPARPPARSSGAHRSANRSGTQFLFAVAADPLGRRVGREHPALPVEGGHADRVVLEQRAVPLLALSEGLLHVLLAGRLQLGDAGLGCLQLGDATTRSPAVRHPQCDLPVPTCRRLTALATRRLVQSEAAECQTWSASLAARFAFVHPMDL